MNQKQMKISMTKLKILEINSDMNKFLNKKEIYNCSNSYEVVRTLGSYDYYEDEKDGSWTYYYRYLGIRWNSLRGFETINFGLPLK